MLDAPSCMHKLINNDRHIKLLLEKPSSVRLAYI